MNGFSSSADIQLRRHRLLGIDVAQALAETRAQRIAKAEARHEKRQRGADRAGKGHQHRALDEAEQGAGGERHDRCAGNRQRGDEHIGEEEQPCRAPGVCRYNTGERLSLALELVKREPLVCACGPERHQNGDDEKKCDPGTTADGD